MQALYLIACLDPTNHSTCITDSTQAQPDGSEMTVMGCMQLGDEVLGQSPGHAKAYHFDGGPAKSTTKEPRIGVTLEARRLRCTSMRRIALARMRDANMAATEITQRGPLRQSTSRQIAEYHLDRYF